MPIAIPGVYQEVKEVIAANVDFVELDFPEPPIGTVLLVRNVSGAIAISSPAPPITAGVCVMGNSDGAQLCLIPGEIYAVTATHGYPVNIPVNSLAYFCIDGRPFIRIFLSTTVGNVISLFTITGDLIATA